MPSKSFAAPQPSQMPISLQMASSLNAFCLFLLISACSLAFLPSGAQAAVLNSYRIGVMQNNGGSRSAAAFFGQSIPSIAERRAAFRELHRRDTENVEFGRLAANANSEAENILADETAAAPSRMPRANNGKLARKNCFFSPLQCSFYYKSNSNFANMLIGGEEH